MDKPTERYLADSELGGFPERVLNDIDEALQAVATLDLDGGASLGRAVAEKVAIVTQQVFELESCIELTREHGWGHRIVGQKQSLAGLVEARLRDADKLSTAALPIQTSAAGSAMAAVLAPEPHEHHSHETTDTEDVQSIVHPSTPLSAVARARRRRT